MQGGRAADGQGYPAYLSEHQSDVVTSITHTGEKKILIHSLDREQTQGYIARTIADLTLQLYLKDTDGHERYKMEFNDYMTASIQRKIWHMYFVPIMRDQRLHQRKTWRRELYRLKSGIHYFATRMKISTIFVKCPERI